MLYERWIDVTAVALVLMLSNCATKTAVNQPTSSEIETAVKAKLQSEPALRDISVSADADKREVTLTGKVGSQFERNQALVLVKLASPGVSVNDKIDVVPRELTRAEYTEDHARAAREAARKFGDKVGDALNDAWVHTKITAKLSGDRDTPARKINVDVVDGAVTLRGTVDDPIAKGEVERIAQQTEGVTRVRNLIVVKKRAT